MTDRVITATLALIPLELQPFMEALDSAVPTGIKRYASIEEIVHEAPEHAYAVALIPASSIPPEQWWNLWGFLQAMEPLPSILVYALRSDFEMWSSVLDAGGFDVLVAPFTVEKLQCAISTASDDFLRRQRE
jgi:FixJ family two-component response regulator